jgi:hypothetical protein
MTDNVVTFRPKVRKYCIDAHEDEIARVGAVPIRELSFGASISTLTTKGVLRTEKDPKTGQWLHEWGELAPPAYPYEDYKTPEAATAVGITSIERDVTSAIRNNISDLLEPTWSPHYVGQPGDLIAPMIDAIAGTITREWITETVNKIVSDKVAELERRSTKPPQ